MYFRTWETIPRFSKRRPKATSVPSSRSGDVKITRPQISSDRQRDYHDGNLVDSWDSLASPVKGRLCSMLDFPVFVFWTDLPVLTLARVFLPSDDWPHFFSSIATASPSLSPFRVTLLGVDFLDFGLYQSWTSCFGLLFQKTSLTPWSLPPLLGEEADSAQDSLCGFLASWNFSNSQRFASPIDRKIKCLPFTVYWIIVLLKKNITGILRLCAANPYSLFFLFYIESMNA